MTTKMSRGREAALAPAGGPRAADPSDLVNPVCRPRGHRLLHPTAREVFIQQVTGSVWTQRPRVGTSSLPSSSVSCGAGAVGSGSVCGLGRCKFSEYRLSWPFPEESSGGTCKVPFKRCGMWLGNAATSQLCLPSPLHLNVLAVDGRGGPQLSWSALGGSVRARESRADPPRAGGHRTGCAALLRAVLFFRRHAVSP